MKIQIDDNAIKTHLKNETHKHSFLRNNFHADKNQTTASV